MLSNRLLIVNTAWLLAKLLIPSDSMTHHSRRIWQHEWWLINLEESVSMTHQSTVAACFCFIYYVYMHAMYVLKAEHSIVSHISWLTFIYSFKSYFNFENFCLIKIISKGRKSLYFLNHWMDFKDLYTKRNVMKRTTKINYW